MAEREYREGAHTIYDLKYHRVWVTKYRDMVLVGEVANVPEGRRFSIGTVHC